MNMMETKQSPNTVASRKYTVSLHPNSKQCEEASCCLGAIRDNTVDPDFQDEDSNNYFDKYIEIYKLWEKQEEYIDKKLEEIQYKDSYTQFLMEEYECQAAEIIKLNQRVRELSFTIDTLSDEVKQLKLDSAENQKRCDYLDRQCSCLRQKNKMLTDILRERGESCDSILDSTFTLDDSRGPVDGLSQGSPVKYNTNRRIKSGMSNDFCDTEYNTLDLQFIPLPQEEKKTEIQEDFPTLFDVEIFNPDGSNVTLSYEDSDAASDDSDLAVNGGLRKQRYSPRKSSSRLSWLTARFRSNKVNPCES